MDKLKHMAVFAHVAKARSLTQAARELGMTTSAVSQQVRQLEKETGVVLLHRTTRHVSLTEAGEVFYEGCAAMLAAARRAEERLTALQDAAVGELTLTAPIGFAERHLSVALAPLLANHPGLSLRLIISDEHLDLVRARIDLAIRIGEAQSSNYVARRLAEWEFALCAAPSYLARKGVPQTPEELTEHDWITGPVTGRAYVLKLAGPAGASRKISVKGRVICDNQPTITRMTLAGLGISWQAVPEVLDELASGQLLRLLPGWSVPLMSVYAITPERGPQPPKVRYAIEAIRAHLTGAVRSTPTDR